ncbi:MAG: hypothetical protein J0I11_17440 [Actinobacteria bacterium]|nr:hypothetical protein [Actinomycetota bacterium]
MSSVDDPASRRADSGAHSGALFDGLIDDAAIFPPGLAPLDLAVARHRDIRGSAVGRYVGPFLLSASRWRELPPLIERDAEPDGAFDVVLINRRGDSLADICDAASGLAHTAGLRVVGVEAALPAGATDATGTVAALAETLPADQRISVEIDDTEPDLALRSIAAAREATGRDVRGKFRTGGTAPADSPSADTLAAVIAAAARLRLPIKFTAGLHHAVTGPHGPSGSRQYGVLNIIAAVHAALHTSDYDDVPGRALVDTLLQIDADRLAAEALSLDRTQALAVRSVFTSFGCCGVLEPLAELADLGVLPQMAQVPPAAPLPLPVEGTSQ